jgi:hypothetical protein
MNIAPGTSQKIAIGPFYGSDGGVLSGSSVHALTLEVNGVPASSSGISPLSTDANGYVVYWMTAADTAIAGDLVLAACVPAASVPWKAREVQVSGLMAAILAAVSMSPIEIRSPIDAGGAMTICQGADYPAGQAICFGVPSTFMSLAGATPSLEITQILGGVAAEKSLLVQPGTLQSGSITINGTTYTQWLQFTLTAEQTAALTNLNPSAYAYRVRCYWYDEATPPAVTQTIEIVSQSPCTAVW